MHALEGTLDIGRLHLADLLGGRRVGAVGKLRVPDAGRQEAQMDGVVDGQLLGSRGLDAELVDPARDAIAQRRAGAEEDVS